VTQFSTVTTNVPNSYHVVERTRTMVLSLGFEQRRGMWACLVGSAFCLVLFWFTVVDEPGRLQNDVLFAGATATFALCALVAGGALLLDRLETGRASN
jgi:hypothetical protein